MPRHMHISLAGQPLLHQKEREGLGNKPTSACPCGMQVTSLNMTFVTTIFAYLLHVQIAPCTEQDQIVLKMAIDSKFCLACTGRAWRNLCHDDSLSVYGTHKFVQTNDTRSQSLSCHMTACCNFIGSLYTGPGNKRM